MTIKVHMSALLCISLLIHGCSSDLLAPSHEGQAAASQTQIQPLALDLPRPMMTEAGDGELELKYLGTHAHAIVTYPAIADGHTVQLRWIGKTTYNTPVQTVGAARPLTFTIPKATLALDAGGTGVLTYSVGVGDNPIETSQPQPISVDRMPVPVNYGPAIAEAINTRYRATAKACPDNKPAYYCNGVIIRSTQNGNYDPWDPADSAMALGGVSFTYMRADAGITTLYHHSGFIFSSQNDAIAANKPVDYLCIYANDASTLSGGRTDKGCGIRVRSTSAADLSSCAAVNVRTLAQWVTYSTSLSDPSYQCSLSTQDAAQFQVSIEARATGILLVGWNELMVGTWAPGTGRRLPLEAFFWKTSVPGSMDEAKIYQTKFKNNTGLWVPILRLDFTQINAKPFTYNAADQAVQP